jgi:microcystin-dependent protein
VAVILSRIKLRRATAGQWSSANPVLALAEPGFETDTKIVRLGDGAATWTSLRAFLSVPQAAISAAQALLDAVDAAAQRVALGLSKNATYDAVGNYVLHFGSSAPAGTLKCNGATISRATYAALFAKIGTTFGAGDGSTTFRLPDLRGEFIRCWDDGRGIDAGRAFGSAQAEEIKSHTHGLTGSTGAAGSHNHIQGHSIWSGWGTKYGSAGAPFTSRGDGVTAGDANPLTSTVADHSHTLSGTATATGGAETRPRNIALLACIIY